MNFKFLSRTLFLVLLVSTIGSITQKAYGQDVLEEFKRRMAELEKVAEKEGTKLLPDVTNSFDPTRGVELKWYNQYDYIKSIAIQKSQDKDKNYATIGYIEKNPKGVTTYVDQKIDFGTTYYRLLIVFSSDLNWYSNVSTVMIDSQSFIAYYKNMVDMPWRTTPSTTTTTKAPPVTSTAPNFTDPSLPNFQFRASPVVFYDFFDKQIHVDIKNGYNPRSTYSIVLKDPMNHRTIGKVQKIPENNVIMDPRNFNSEGLLEFELMEGGKVIEKGFIQIQ